MRAGQHFKQYGRRATRRFTRPLAMADQDTNSKSAANLAANPGYADLHEHIARLDAAGLLYRIDEPVNKDTEMHPLVRWQFRGGIPEAERKAFLFTNIVDSKGRKYDIPVIVGGIAANPEVYRVGMNVQSLDDIGDAWDRAVDHPIPPVPL